MENFVVTFNNIDSQNTLVDPYENIQGKNYLDALEKRFSKQFKRLMGDDGRYANVIIVKGTYDKDNNMIYYSGKRCVRLCYGLV